MELAANQEQLAQDSTIRFNTLEGALTRLADFSAGATAKLGTLESVVSQLVSSQTAMQQPCAQLAVGMDALRSDVLRRATDTAVNGEGPPGQRSRHT